MLTIFCAFGAGMLAEASLTRVAVGQWYWVAADIAGAAWMTFMAFGSLRMRDAGARAKGDQ